MTAILPANPSVIPGAGDLVVSGPPDVLAVAPGFVQQAQGAPAPVRDALVAGLDGVNERYQELAGYAAAQCDVLRATDMYLVGLAEDRGYFQQPGEGQEAFRSRVIGVPSQVTPAAIVAAVNAILAPFTTVQCQYLESVGDRVFLTDGTAPFHSFWVGASGAAPGDASPQYPDRLYRDDARTGGVNAVSVPNRDPGGPWAFSDVVGRYFVLRVPVVQDTSVSLAYFGITTAIAGGGTMTSGNNVLSISSGAAFFPSDVGDAIAVSGAGPIGGLLFATIAAVVTPLQVTITTNASTNVSTAVATWGRPNFVGPNDVVAPELGGAEAGAQQTSGSVVTEPTPTAGNLATTAGGRGLFVADGSNTSGAEADGRVALFLYSGGQSALATYQSMVNAVERIRGSGVRWMLYADPNLIN